MTTTTTDHEACPTCGGYDGSHWCDSTPGRDQWRCTCGHDWTIPVDESGPRRVLVTGSRTWTDPAIIRRALTTVWGDGAAVLVSGACPDRDRPRR